jgi:hypothetical protein
MHGPGVVGRLDSADDPGRRVSRPFRQINSTFLPLLYPSVTCGLLCLPFTLLRLSLLRLSLLSLNGTPLFVPLFRSHRLLLCGPR